ncbi:MAG: hypothetical protein AB7I19_00855 [Planctomycetota bacterium]
MVDDQLRVGHERAHLRAERTLRAMYLEPLARAARAGGGRWLDGDRPFLLLVDIKADGEAVYARLREQLAEYAWMLSSYSDGERRDGAVTVILSGDRPRLAVANDAARLCAIDGPRSAIGRAGANSRPHCASSSRPWSDAVKLRA